MVWVVLVGMAIVGGLAGRSWLTEQGVFKSAPATLEGVGGVAEGLIGVALCSTGAGAVVGVPMVIGSSFHMSSGLLDLWALSLGDPSRYGTHNLLRNAAMKVNLEHGSVVYDVVILVLILLGGGSAYV